MSRLLRCASIALLSAWAPCAGAAAPASSPAAAPADRVALAAFSFAGYSRHDSHVIVATTGAPRLRVDLCQPGIARIWVDPTGRLAKPASYGVADEHWTGVPFTVSESPAYLRIQTSELTVRVWKKPLRVTFHLEPSAPK